MIDVRHMTPVQIQEAGLRILSRELGPVGLIRFLQQYELGSGDYTKERRQWLDHLSVEDVVKLVQAEQNADEESAPQSNQPRPILKKDS
jgi:hypothetical protein